MYARLLTSERWSATAANEARWKKNINTLNARPIKVFSPYQMLKALFQIRGFEAMLTTMRVQLSFSTRSTPMSQLALRLSLRCYKKHLREQYSARFFVMSATFPKLIREQLRNMLGAHSIIQADADVFKNFT